MKCPNCPIEMDIDHTGKSVAGDNDPNTPTRVYEHQYFTCRNPKCTKFGQIIPGEPILIYDGGVDPVSAAMARQIDTGKETVECCGMTLATYDDHSITATDSGAGMVVKDGNMEITCPSCQTVKTVSMDGKTNLSGSQNIPAY